MNGPVRKVPNHPLKIIHHKYDAFHKSTAKNKVKPKSLEEFERSFDTAKQGISDLDKHLRRAVDDMNPLRVLNLFRRISADDCELLGLDPVYGRPEMFIWQYIPAPPAPIRPSVSQDGNTNEDDITMKLGDIIDSSNLIRVALDQGQSVQMIMEIWDFLQIQIAQYVNSQAPGLPPGRPIRGFCQRLKGKGGRFRQNLSGKRVDFSGRTVISPDPNLGIDEVAVPDRVAKILTYPEKVSVYNIEKLKKCVARGPYEHPGANLIYKKNNKMPIRLNRVRHLQETADNLQIGDTVDRHLEDGDIVLFNRQPSLHKLSILCHKAKIRPWRTFRLNECVCNPYNADFDGDEMNLHVPQTEEARAEAMELMGVKYNLATPKNGAPIIAAIQDFITAAYLISRKDNFYDRKTFSQICGFMFNDESVVNPDTGEHLPIELPAPAILKPQRLWTGKQIFNVLMQPNHKLNVKVNLEAICKQYAANPEHHRPDLSEDDAYLVIRNSEVMCGVMDKATVGDGKKDSVFYVILRDFGPDHAVQAMNRLAKLSARWLTNHGFSIGITDVTPGEKLVAQKQRLVTEAYAKCDEIIRLFKDHKLIRDAGCDEEQTMENQMGGILSNVRQKAGDECFRELSRWNSAVIMAQCGSKGSNINVSQMVASVGQQMIGGKRVENGFQDRTLPHFPKNARQPISKGFVSNSFYSGLTPPEFIFHAMSGREGLVDTAVKTAETGYMSRRLMKSLEDLSAQYDGTVRNSSAHIVQFQYGDDNLDPADMEGKAKPVNFERTFTHALTSTAKPSEALIAPNELASITERKLRRERIKLRRVPLAELDTNARFRKANRTSYSRHPLETMSAAEIEELPTTVFFDMLGYNNYDKDDLDQLESKRDFLDAVENFIKSKAEMLIWQRERHPDRDNIGGISPHSLDTFLGLCIRKYERSKVQPGHAVGAVGAQSIGEPGTQMTLKTFHFAGVAGMSITQGVPRIKEIINASSKISTPVITCELQNSQSEQAARIVKGRIEKTYLRDVVSWIEENWDEDGCYLEMRFDTETRDKLQLDIDMAAIAKSIENEKTLKLPPGSKVIFHTRTRLRLIVGDPENANTFQTIKGKQRAFASRRQDKDKTEHFLRCQRIKRLLPNIVIKGYPEANRAIIKKGDKPLSGTKDRYEYTLLIEGYGLQACMTTEGINGSKTRTNSVIETKEVLGIEAARRTIIDEIGTVMERMDIDPRHMQLLADVMTCKGDVLGITRFGLSKMNDSVLQLASFEKTPDHLFDAAWRKKVDRIQGVSECIIMGQSTNIGSGAFKVVRPLNDLYTDGGHGLADVKRRRCRFDELAKAMRK
jgi:DNA-directed RNA polymerase III subunit RPC1